MNDTIVFDIETQKSFEEVGGRDKLHLLGISVLAAYSYNYKKCFVFDERNILDFQKMIDTAGTLIGFNSNGFDVPILKSYNFKLDKIYSLDLMEDVKNGAGFRVSLDNIANATLGLNKTADGLQALKWYKEGNIAAIKKYCVSDVQITRDVYEYGKNNNHVFFVNRVKGKVAVSVFWGAPKQRNIKELLNDAFNKRQSVEIEYLTHFPAKKDEPKNIRLIDIYEINGGLVRGFCHLRNENRIFKEDRILSARITDKVYKTENDVQGQLL